MTKKEKFVYVVDELFSKTDMSTFAGEYYEDVMAYWGAYKGKEEADKPLFTDNGKLILKYMQEHVNDAPMSKARDIAEGLFIQSRAVSGAMRNLVSNGFVEKIGKDPVIYSLTEKGKEITIED